MRVPNWKPCAKSSGGRATLLAADITTATEIVDVLIEDLRVVEVAGRQTPFCIRLSCAKSTPPLDPLAGVNTGILGDAQGLSTRLWAWPT